MPHQKGLDYLDLLLWSFPKESFLPHCIQHGPCDDLIVLTFPQNNPNQSRYLLNLCPDPVEDGYFESFKIYELEDMTSANHNHLAQNRYKFYKSKGLGITVVPKYWIPT